VGRTCSTNAGGERKALFRSRFENLKGRNYTRNLGADDRIILDSIFRGTRRDCGLDANCSGPAAEN
jgi:hypothetical protein